MGGEGEDGANSPARLAAEARKARARAAAVDDDASLISALDVRELCGGVSGMTLWRWLRNEKLGFPRPVKYSARNYWRRGEIRTWLASLPPTAPKADLPAGAPSHQP